MRSLILIPFIYFYSFCFIYKRKSVNIIKVKIFYKIDSFTYEVINQEFPTEEYTNKEVDLIITKLIKKLDEKFR